MRQRICVCPETQRLDIDEVKPLMSDDGETPILR